MKKEQETENNKTEEEKKGDMRKEVVSWIRMFVIVIAVVFVLTQFVIINVRVPSGSMENTIMTKDRLIGFRFSYWFDEPQRGDIILFSYPVDEKQTYIKRVIGLPGETVEIRDGKIYIDGSSEPLEEDYLKETWTWENDGYTFNVPEGCYFVLGDNRNDSEDGRFWAQIALNEGKASTAEEAEQYSYVKKDEIKGKAIFKYYSKFAILTNK
ncbi:signal peptidase I [uncultured Eubacterium sp.]|uniref:signal peptidase I n=1 Tax=uncultured Eubacterium sp. TaxID=165185 RepID=UPI0015B2925D|nr:signal peptidase I [uncultured Eubacterium sp.]